MKKYISNSVQETEEIAKEVAVKLKGTETIAFYGGLGSGKTTFTAGLVKALESQDDVSSPTFALINEYEGKYNIYHFDMYRINTWDDLYSTGFFDYLGLGIIIIEWSENIENALPENSVKIKITRGEKETERIFEISGENF